MGGSPGGSDALELRPEDDLIAYRLVSSTIVAGKILELQLRLGSDSARHLVEWSSDLQVWRRESMTRLSVHLSGPDFVERWRLENQSPTVAFYFRVRITEQ